MSKVLTLALGLTLGSCAIQPEYLFEVTAVEVNSPGLTEVWSANTFRRTDIRLTKDSVFFYEAGGPHNHMQLYCVMHRDSVVAFEPGNNDEGEPYTLTFNEGVGTIKYLLYDLQNHYE